MQKLPSQSSQRFADPLGNLMRTTTDAHEQHLARFPSAEENYDGFYTSVTPATPEDMGYLAGAAGIIGSEFKLALFAEGYGVATHDGRQLALLDAATSARLAALLEQGWVVRCFLAYTVYRADNKTMSGTFACLCYNSLLGVEYQEALGVFVHNLAGRIANADHPGLSLAQEQFVRVLESKGAWFLTKNEPWPTLPKGWVYYRRRRSLSDHLVEAALKGNRGCLVASWTVIAIIALAVLVAIYWLVFR